MRKKSGCWEELERHQMVQARENSGLDLNWPHVGCALSVKWTGLVWNLDMEGEVKGRIQNDAQHFGLSMCPNAGEWMSWCRPVERPFGKETHKFWGHKIHIKKRHKWLYWYLLLFSILPFTERLLFVILLIFTKPYGFRVFPPFCSLRKWKPRKVKSNTSTKIVGLSQVYFFL